MLGAWYETDSRNQTIVIYVYIIIKSVAPLVGSFCSLKYLWRRGMPVQGQRFDYVTL